jgi:multidrug efflux system membrane fusion protein
MNKNWRWMQLSWTFLLLLVFGGCQSANSTKEKQALAATTRSVPVGVASAVEQDMPVYLTGLGSVTAYNTVSVKSRVDGQLIQVNFREGQQVKKGDLLVLIDPRPYQVQLASAQAQLFKDQAQLRDAQLNYERFKELLQVSGAMSQQQVDTQKALADQFEGAVRADQATIDNAKLQLVYCHITAPVSGHIGLRLVDAGNIVHANDTNAMLVITQLQPISVIFTLPEDSLPVVVKRMKQGALTVDAYGRDDKTKLATGTLLTIDNQIDQTTGTDRQPGRRALSESVRQYPPASRCAQEQYDRSQCGRAARSAGKFCLCSESRQDGGGAHRNRRAHAIESKRDWQRPAGRRGRSHRRAGQVAERRES